MNLQHLLWLQWPGLQMRLDFDLGQGDKVKGRKGERSGNKSTNNWSRVRPSTIAQAPLRASNGM